MATMPCVVCKYPVEIEESKLEVWETPDHQPGGKASVLVVCGSKRCQRLAKREMEKDRGRVQ